MRSPFTAEFPPPLEPPPGIEPAAHSAWVTAAERWTPDHEAADRELLIALAHANQQAVPKPIADRLRAEAEQVLTEHLPEHEGAGNQPHCKQCSAKHAGFRILYPCLPVLLARRITIPQRHPEW